MSDEYDPSQIEELDALEAIRRRPQMYLPQEGNVRNALLMDALCIPLAEAHCGSCSSISIFAEGRHASISHDGIGLPVEPVRDGITLPEILFTQLYACRDYKTHSDLGHELCGAGVVIVNAVSEALSLDVHHDGEIHRVEFRGGVVSQPLRVVGTSSRTGNEIQFTIDERFAGAEDFDLDALRVDIDSKEIDLSRTEITIQPGRNKRMESNG